MRVWACYSKIINLICSEKSLLPNYKVSLGKAFVILLKKVTDYKCEYVCSIRFLFSVKSPNGSWSLDQISLDLFSRSKVFKLIFGTRSNYFSFFTRSKDFGTRSKVLIMEFLAFKTFNLVKKFASFFWH
jgi:hypothetical protein